jgi:hypothetical protein
MMNDRYVGRASEALKTQMDSMSFTVNVYVYCEVCRRSVIHDSDIGFGPNQ